MWRVRVDFWGSGDTEDYRRIEIIRAGGRVVERDKKCIIRIAHGEDTKCLSGFHV